MSLGNRTQYPHATLVKRSAAGSSTGSAATIYELEITNRPDNRLTPDLIRKTLLPALEDIEADWRADRANGGGEAALITYGPRDADRFYSNGLDLGLSMTTPAFWPRLLNPVFARLLTFPIPTVAAINGHAFAGGMCLALAHDYRVMKGYEGPDRKKACEMAMNEIEFGAAIPLGMMAVLRAKIPSINTLRSVLLEGKRFNGPQALSAQLVDQLADDGQAVVDAANKLALQLAPKAAPGAWGVIKHGIYQEALKDLAIDKGGDGSGPDVVKNLQRIAERQKKAKL